MFARKSKERRGLPGGSSGKASAGEARDSSAIPGSGRSPGRGDGKPTPVLFPGKSHGQRRLVGYSPWSPKESDRTNLATKTASVSVAVQTQAFCSHTTGDAETAETDKMGLP